VQTEPVVEAAVGAAGGTAGEDVEDVFEDAVEYLVADAVEGEVIEMQNLPLEAVVVEGVAPIPVRRDSIMSTPM
jgi:hypothetical protein